MNQEQLRIMSGKKGFIAALDQSGGSTPKALKNYGIREDQYSNDEEMFNLVHEMRTRIITSPSFTSDHILAAILFENTMERKIGDKLTADYLWEEKGIIPILKVDKGLAEEADGVRLILWASKRLWTSSLKSGFALRLRDWFPYWSRRLIFTVRIRLNLSKS